MMSWCSANKKAVLYALKQSGWLISVKKCIFSSENLIFLGCSWQMDEESSRMNNDRLQSILNPEERGGVRVKAYHN